MIFTTNTKPLNDAISLGIINGNITTIDKKSGIVQLTATADKLRINVETSRIRTQLEVLGNGEGEDYFTIFVSSTLLKQLMSTITSPTVKLDLSDAGLTIIAGKSKFTLPKMFDIVDIELNQPEIPDNYMDNAVDVDKTTWKYVKENQMYAVATSFAHPVYCNVFVGGESGVIVGDYDNSIFTYSTSSTFGNQCLLSPTILNLLISLPDGAKITRIDKSYLVFVTLDSFSYVTQFTPMYEGDEGIGSYHSEIFLGLMQHTDTNISVNASEITKYLSQAEMLNTEAIPRIDFIVNGDTVTLKDHNVSCEVSLTNPAPTSYTTKFKTAFLKKLMSNYGDKIVNVQPLIDSNGEVSGILVWDDTLTSMLACEVAV